MLRTENLPDCSMLPDKPLRQKFVDNNGKLLARHRLRPDQWLAEAVKFTLVSPQAAFFIGLPAAILLGLALDAPYGGGIIVLAIAVLAVYIRDRRAGSRGAASFEAFMRANNASFGGMLTKDANLPVVYGSGRHRGRDNAVRLLHNGVHIGLFQYRFTTGYGIKQRMHKYTVMHVKLGKKVPHIVLDSRVNDRVYSSLPAIFDDDQRIELEGNFGKYFDLFAPDFYRTDALSLVSPDFMQMLIDQHTPYDLELNGYDAFLIYKGNALSKSELVKMFKATDALISAMSRKLKTWNFKESHGQSAELRQNKGEKVLRFGRSRISPFAMVLPLAAVLIYVAASGGEVQPLVLALVLLVSFGISLAYEKRRYEKRRLDQAWGGRKAKTDSSGSS